MGFPFQLDGVHKKTSGVCLHDQNRLCVKTDLNLFNTSLERVWIIGLAVPQWHSDYIKCFNRLAILLTAIGLCVLFMCKIYVDSA